MSYFGAPNPYGPRPHYKPGTKTHCESCDRVMDSKDWPAHEASKKHQHNKLVKEFEITAGSSQNDDAANTASSSHGAGACHNCGQLGHKSKECPEPKSTRNVECHRCHEKGHFSKDCPTEAASRTCHNCKQERHMSKDCPEPKVRRCRNCDSTEHLSKECDQPRDWSRVKCRNCGEMGHGAKKCPKPAAIDEQPAAGGEDEPATNSGEPFTMADQWESSMVAAWESVRDAPESTGIAHQSW